MMSTEIQEALNRQINDDYCLWYFYRSAAAHCREANLHGLSKWLRRRSETNLRQADRLSDFMVQRGGHVEATPIDATNGHSDSPFGILEAALDRERRLGQSAARLAELSVDHGDHATHDLLERVVSDHVEAEAKVQSVRDRLKTLADAPAGLFMVDRDLA